MSGAQIIYNPPHTFNKTRNGLLKHLNVRSSTLNHYLWKPGFVILNSGTSNLLHKEKRTRLMKASLSMDSTNNNELDVASLLKNNENIEKKLRIQCLPFWKGRLPVIIAEKRTHDVNTPTRNLDQHLPHHASVAWEEQRKAEGFLTNRSEKESNDLFSTPNFLEKCSGVQESNQIKSKCDGVSKEEYRDRAKQLWDLGSAYSPNPPKSAYGSNEKESNSNAMRDSRREKVSNNDNNFKEVSLESIAGPDFVSDVTGDHKNIVRSESKLIVKNESNGEEDAEKGQETSRNDKEEASSENFINQGIEERNGRKGGKSKAVDMAEQEMIIELAAEKAVSGPKEAWEMAEADAKVLSENSGLPEKELLDEITKGAEEISEKISEEISDKDTGEDFTNQNDRLSGSLFGFETISEVGLAVGSISKEGKEVNEKVGEMFVHTMEEIQDRVGQVVHLGQQGKQVVENLIHKAAVNLDEEAKVIADVVENTEEKLSEVAEVGKQGTEAMKNVMKETVHKADESMKFIARTVEEIEKEVETMVEKVDEISKESMVEESKGKQDDRKVQDVGIYKEEDEKRDEDAQDEFEAAWEKSLLGEEWEHEDKYFKE